MPLPDKHANEPTVEVDEDLYAMIQAARDAVDAWTKELNRLKKKLTEQIGDAYAATVHGEKVYTYRPKDSYAEARLIKDYPDLTQHFFAYRTENVFDMDKFREAHPDIAAQYRVRALVEVKAT